MSYLHILSETLTWLLANALKLLMFGRDLTIKIISSMNMWERSDNYLILEVAILVNQVKARLVRLLKKV